MRSQVLLRKVGLNGGWYTADVDDRGYESNVHDLFTGFAGGGGGANQSPAVSATLPAWNTWSQYELHIDRSFYEYDGWASSMYSGASWHGYTLSYDLFQSTSPWSATTSVSTSMHEYWGSYFSGPDFYSSSSHSVLDQYSTLSETTPWSSLYMQEASHDVFDFSSFHSGALTMQSQHEERDASSVTIQQTPWSTYIGLETSHDTWDSGTFQFGPISQEWQSQTHQDQSDLYWRTGWNTGRTTELNAWSHQESVNSGPGYTQTNVVDTSYHEASSLVTGAGFGGFGLDMLSVPVHHDWLVAA